MICGICKKSVEQGSKGLWFHSYPEPDISNFHLVEPEEEDKRAWGVVLIDEREMHVVPMVDVGDGEVVVSAAHDCRPNCRCGPVKEITQNGVTMWQHHDPEHDGAMSDKEWSQLKARARGETSPTT